MAVEVKTDKQIYLLLAAHADAFRLLTGGIELPGPYRGRSVAFKELERRADHVFEPESGTGPVYIIEIQAQRYWFSLIVLQAFDFKLDRRDEPHLNSQYLPP